MKKLFWSLAFALVLLVCRPTTVYAQGGGTTINLADCTSATLQAELNSLNTAAGAYTLVLPACPSGVSWTNSGSTPPVAWTEPSGLTSFTLQGQTTCTPSTPGMVATSCTDNTVIIDHVNRGACNCAMFNFTGNGNSATVFNLIGITWKQDSTSQNYANGDLGLGGDSQNFRVSQNHFITYSGSSDHFWMGIYNWQYGVLDHNVCDLTSSADNVSCWRISGGNYYGDSSGNGNGSWSNPTNWGTNQFIYSENNTFNGGIANDCNDGGRQVFRYNVFNDSSIQTHEMESDSRGCRASEMSNNTFNGVNGHSITSFTAIGIRMGTLLSWGNIVNLEENLITLDQDRTNGHPFGTPPVTTGNWGYCGTLGSIPGPSDWDGNSVGSTGYPCIDQAGRGQGDVLSGLFPTKCDITTYPTAPPCNSYLGSWPHNKLEPVYQWLDQYQVGAGSGWNKSVYNAEDPNTFYLNQDYFGYTLSWNGSAFTGTAFNGTVGTGSGLLSARPSTCTAGPGGTYGASPTGSYGVAYWATDTSTLYVCTASPGTWTAIYTPYTYPHPLTTGVADEAFTPASETFPVELVNNTSKNALITFTYAGSGTLTLTGLAPTANFSINRTGITSPCNVGTMLTQNGTCGFNVTFSPGETLGTITGDVMAAFTGDPNNSSLQLPLQGTSTEVTLSTKTLAFGTVSTGTKNLSVTVTNKGTTPLQFSGTPTITGTGSSQFAVLPYSAGPPVISSCLNGTVILDQNQTCTFTVQFTHMSDSNSFSTSLNIFDNDPTSPQVVTMTAKD